MVGQVSRLAVGHSAASRQVRGRPSLTHQLLPHKNATKAARPHYVLYALVYPGDVMGPIYHSLVNLYDTITIEDELGVGGCGGEAPAANRLPPFIGSPIRVETSSNTQRMLYFVYTAFIFICE